MAIQILIPGPLHPDLFDGLTPMMIPCEVEAYQVRWAELTSHLQRLDFLAQAGSSVWQINRVASDIIGLDATSIIDPDYVGEISDDRITQEMIDVFVEQKRRENRNDVCHVGYGAYSQ